MGWIGSTLVYVFFTILIYRLDFARKRQWVDLDSDIMFHINYYFHDEAI